MRKVEIYPREGTETTQNAGLHTSVHVEIYPREGTETFAINPIFNLISVEIYPREGTETRPASPPPAGYSRWKFIPVRGRKLGLLPEVCRREGRVEIYPREGTETFGKTKFFNCKR